MIILFSTIATTKHIARPYIHAGRLSLAGAYILQTIKLLRELGSGHARLLKVIFIGFSKHKCDVLESLTSTQLDRTSFCHVLGPTYVW